MAERLIDLVLLFNKKLWTVQRGNDGSGRNATKYLCCLKPSCGGFKDSNFVAGLRVRMRQSISYGCNWLGVKPQRQKVMLTLLKMSTDRS